MRWIIIYDSSFLPIRYNSKRNSFTAIFRNFSEAFFLFLVSCIRSVHASNVLRHAERMHALSSCVWSGEEKKKIKKKLRCIVDYDYWPNGCVDLVNSRTSIRYALENSSCAIILLRSFTSRLLEFLLQLFYYSWWFFKRKSITACNNSVSCEIITIRFEVILLEGIISIDKILFIDGGMIIFFKEELRAK